MFPSFTNKFWNPLTLKDDAKVEVDTVNIWYSVNVKKWNVCALEIVEDEDTRASDQMRRRRKKSFDKFEEAVEYVKETYSGGIAE